MSERRKTQPTQPTGPSDYTVLVSNFTRDANHKDIFDAMKREIEQRFWPLTESEARDLPGIDAFTVTVPNMMQMQALLWMNGLLIRNYPVWVCRFSFLLTDFTGVLRSAIQMNYSDGVVDLSYLRDKWTEADGDNLSKGRQLVNMNNRDFVEFVLFTVGMWARDERMWVHSLALSNNGIVDANPWASFFHFLPNLRYLNLMDNPLTQPTRLIWFPWIHVDEDPVPVGPPGDGQGGPAGGPDQGQGYQAYQGQGYQGQGQGYQGQGYQGGGQGYQGQGQGYQGGGQGYQGQGYQGGGQGYQGQGYQGQGYQGQGYQGQGYQGGGQGDQWGDADYQAPEGYYQEDQYQDFYEQ